MARGGFEIQDMAWKNGRITRLVIRLTLGGNTPAASQRSGEGLKAAKGKNANPLFCRLSAAAGAQPAKVKLNAVTLPKTWTYDVATKAGELVKLYLNYIITFV
jgi:alpha-L-fucosidase 2